jgi:hypothetical protein
LAHITPAHICPFGQLGGDWHQRGRITQQALHPCCLLAHTPQLRLSSTLFSFNVELVLDGGWDDSDFDPDDSMDFY